MTAPEDAQVGSRVLWQFVSLAVRVFYHVERVGPPLPDGALLLVANHPNALVDPSLVHTTAGRPVRFLAKSTLFKGQFLSPLIRGSGAIPVYRKIDPGVDTSRNREMFAAVQQALASGHALCLFPEGISHASGHLEQLRSGAARMALTSAVAGHPVTIVPVGLNFDRLPMFRSRVTAMFGQPFDGADLVAAFTEDPRGAAQRLTDRITERLRELMVEADPRADLPLVDRIDRLYAAARGVSRDPADRIRRRGLIAAGIERLRASDPPQYHALLDDLRVYDAQLQAFGPRESDLDRRMPVGQVTLFLLREGTRALVLAPLALLGVFCFAPAYWLTWAISRRAPDLQSRATWQVIFGVPVYAGWIAALATGVGLWVGIGRGIAAAIVLPVLAFVGLVAFEREASVLKMIRAFLASRQTPLRARASLKRQRAAIATVLDRVRDRLETTDPANTSRPPGPSRSNHGSG
jgi:1-acyl-sn-glycerol-3-phosphate acyltransferase